MPTYYVKNGGSDAADGLSDGTAWETLEKVRTTALIPGDTVLFNRGDTWSEAAKVFTKVGTTGNPVTFGAYGTGDKPIFSGASSAAGSDFIDFSPFGETNTGDLTIQNIRFTAGKRRNLRLRDFTGHIILDSCDFDDCADGGAGGNPGMVQMSNCSGSGLAVDCTFTDTLNDGAYLWNAPNWEFDSCTFTGVSGTTSDCIQFTGAAGNYSSGWHVHDCTFDMTGTASPKGCVLTENGTGATFEDNTTIAGLFGLSTSSTSDITCRRNTMRDHTGANDAGAFRYDSTASITGLTLTDNVMVDCTNGIVTFQNAAWTTTTTLIAHNTIIDPVRYGIAIETGIGGTIRDNIISGAPSQGMLRVADPGTVTIDYNDYFGGTAFSYDGSDYATLALYQAGASQDANSFAIDPRLTGAYTLFSDSPMIDAASDGGDIGREWGAYQAAALSATRMCARRGIEVYAPGETIYL